ncbi:MAG: cytochrome c maturation protein CcmE [Hyphomicrobiales bacterium]|nr:cytochrome c maturation protein CcmE [Hyphomicrobiales bacterium]
MTRKQRRLTLIGAAGFVLALAVGLVLFALNDQIVFFYSPTDVAAKDIAAGTRIRLGGLVEEGSLEKGGGGAVSFAITDAHNRMNVKFVGILPDLFREGQGVIAEGTLDADGSFKADSVLAKHDETYMPREVADVLKEQGVWQGEGEKTTQ